VCEREREREKERDRQREIGVGEYVQYRKKNCKICGRLQQSLEEVKLHMILTGFALEVLLVEFLLFDGTSTSECSTVQPIARRAFNDSLTGSL
jgi:hypothetical protein